MSAATTPGTTTTGRTVSGSPWSRRAGEWVDRFLGSDPGLNRLRMATQSVLSIGAILLAEYVFVRLTHALQIQTHGAVLPAAQAAQVAAANHEYLVIGMLLGAIVGMISSFGVMDATASGQLKTSLFIPVPMIAALTLGLSIGGHRVLALTSLALVLSGGTYLRRFGPRGFVAGLLLFMGDFFGFFLHSAVTLSDLGWLAAEIGVGVLVAITVRFTLFFPRADKALARTQRSYTARARKVAALALELFEDPAHTDRQAHRLRRQLVRLNEAALMIDAQLGDPSAVQDGSSGQLLHQRLFDVELALTNVARFAPIMARLELPAAQCEQVRAALRAVAIGDPVAAKASAQTLLLLLQRDKELDTGRGVDTRRVAGSAPDEGMGRSAVVVTHRFAGSVADLADAMTDWTALGMTAGEKGTFEPAVTLFGGWLPGSTQVSAVASMEPGQRFWDRVSLAPYTRTAIQMGLAVGAAIALGDVLSGRRFYWAVIAAFVTFMGASNSGEQARKAAFRVVGTIVGIGIGSLLVRLVGHHTAWSLAVILIALFFGFYLMRVNYAFMVVGITVMVSQLYVQLDEFSNSLLLLRLEETAIGAGVAVAVVLLVFPLRTRRVLRVAMRSYVTAIATLVEHATGRMLGEREHQLRADARAVDASYQAVLATNVPIRHSPFTSPDETIAAAMRQVSASRHYARNLVADVEAIDRLDPESRADIAQGRATLARSLDIVTGAFNGPRDGVYTRSASLFDRAERRLEEHAHGLHPAQLAIRDLTLVDGAMASLAQTMALRITDLDTTDPAPSGRPSSLQHSNA